MAAALLTPRQLLESPADASLQLTLALLKQPQQTLIKKTGIAAPIVKGNDGYWSTAQLSTTRGGVGATSLPSQGLALFAGGGGALLT